MQLHPIILREVLYELTSPAIITVSLYLIMIAATIIDLFSGVRKAKSLGIFRSSKVYRRTIDKLNSYLMLMTLLSFIDIVQETLLVYLTLRGSINVLPLPICGAVGAVIVCFIEFKSVKEKANDKVRQQLDEAIANAGKFLSENDKREMLERIFESLKSTKE